MGGGQQIVPSLSAWDLRLSLLKSQNREEVIGEETGTGTLSFIFPRRRAAMVSMI